MCIIKKIKYYFKKCFKRKPTYKNIKNIDIAEELLFSTEDIFLNNIQTSQLNNLSEEYYNCFESYEEMVTKT